LPLIQRLLRRPLRRVPRRALPSGARRARGRVLHPGRVEGCPPASVIVLSQLKVVALAVHPHRYSPNPSPRVQPGAGACRARSYERMEHPAKPRATASASALPCPVACKSLAVPADHGLRPHHLQRMPPARPQPRQQNPENPVHFRQPWPRLTCRPHGELLPQREVLERQLAVCANSASQCPKEDSQPANHDRPHLSWETRRCYGTLDIKARLVPMARRRPDAGSRPLSRKRVVASLCRLASQAHPKVATRAVATT